MLEALALRRARMLAVGLLSSLLFAGDARQAPSNPPPPASPAAPHVAPIQPNANPQAVLMIDIPQEWRRENWSPYGQGSCVHATTTMLLHWQGQHQLADWWEQTHHSGETAHGLATKLEAAGIRYAETRSGDLRFLEWAVRTVRGCGVVVRNGVHMVLLVHLDQRHAGLLDNNSPRRIQWRPRAQFLAEWQAAGGWAVTPVYTPPPPAPTL